jgi:hypothetical protein
VRLASLWLVLIACGQDICSLGGCCELVSGAWTMRFVDCALPADAGIDALPDGAPDA